jgi:hypothetical protein
MGNDWGEEEGKDWGGSEVHDWGVPPAPDSTLLIPDQPLATADDPMGDPLPVGTDSDADTTIQAAVLTAMNNWKHSSLATETEEDGPTEYVLGSGDSALYVIDDGKDHCMIGRAVGEDGDGCIYCLVARISLDRYVALRDDGLRSEDGFADSRDVSLCSVFMDDEVSNVVLIRHYKRIEDVPSEYRPPSPFLRFTDE